jgi:hypothetical protein
MDTKYDIIIKNNEKPKAETNETPSCLGLTNHNPSGYSFSC